MTIKLSEDDRVMVEIEHIDETITNGACWKIEEDHVVVLVSASALSISVAEVCFDLESGHRVIIKNGQRECHEWPRLMAHSLRKVNAKIQ